MTSEPSPPRRVRVTSPRAAADRSLPRSVLSEIDEETALGEVYMRSLVRSQLRLGIGVVALLGLTVGLLPLLFAAVPASRRLDLLGVPLPWLLLGGLVYPGLVGLGWFYVHRAERIEAAFSDLVGRR